VAKMVYNMSMYIHTIKSGHQIILDDEDKHLAERSWQLNSVGYARRTMYSRETKKLRTALMHREIIGAKKGQVVDHKNGNKLDNRKANLRVCTQSQNQANRLKSASQSSKYKGVCLTKNFRPARWEASLTVNGVRYRKIFMKETDAAKWYDQQAIKYFGKFALTNKKQGELL